ncbi:MAG: hypothetical protein RBR45_10585 [Pseudomonas sp.]|nr:hypothetical protein [Pseudomonas sp.]
MKFQVSEEFKRKGRRNAILASLVVILLIVGAVWMFIDSTSAANKTIAAVLAFILVRKLPQVYRNIRDHDLSYPEIEILEADNKLDVLYKGAVVSMPLAEIEKLVIQSGKGRIKSILVSTPSVGDLRFEGYENVEQLAALLTKYTPEKNVKHATWYHR